jgi:hypothetical protein
MKGKDKREEDAGGKTRMELKYCERCGGLWIRESGAGVVYCANCRPEVADLPAPKKKPGRVRMPVRPRTQVEDYRIENPNEDDMNFEAAGGAA